MMLLKKSIFRQEAVLTITENEIFTLIAGDTIKKYECSGDFTIENNVFTEIDDLI